MDRGRKVKPKYDTCVILSVIRCDKNELIQLKGERRGVEFLCEELSDGSFRKTNLFRINR